MYTVLVPVDYSNTSLKALEVALYLAARIKGELLLCHVYQPPVLVDDEMNEDDPEAFLMTEADSKPEALKKLQTFAALVHDNSPGDVPISLTVETGSIVEQLQKLIKAHDVALVVMGTGKPTSLLNQVFGSTTEKMMKTATCPVLAVPERAQPNPFGRIVYTTSLDPSEANALAQLAQARRLYNSTIAVLHVETEDQRESENITSRKNELLKEFHENELMFAQVKSKDVTNGIEEFVLKFNADLVSFTVTHHTFLHNLTHISVISRLIHDLNLPLLAFPSGYSSRGISQAEEIRKAVG